MRSGTATARNGRRRADAASGHTIMGVPARFMRPRIVLIGCTVFLAIFGLLMIYSASSIVALSSASYGHDAAFFLVSQLRNLIVGIILAGMLFYFDYHVWMTGWRIIGASFLIVVLLILVHTNFAGHDAYGASRWINIGGFTLQPSEFAKPVLLLAAAEIFGRYFEERSLGMLEFALMIGIFLIVPLGLILVEPDKGTTLILVATLLAMLLVAGIPLRYLLGFLAIIGVLFGILIMGDSYSHARVVTATDPWADPLGSGYQLIQGFYAFGAGGLTGVGIGFSHQKYAYLPMAHNDFIFAIIGEECGLVGTVGTIVLFLAILLASYRIATYAPDLKGRLLACGCSTLLVVQLLVNVCGVLALIPLSGKPIPFLSYGGSSIIASCILVGLILSVSRASILPETEHDRARSRMRVADGQPDPHDGVGAVRTRSESRVQDARRGFSVFDGGAGSAGTRSSADRSARRSDARRIDLDDPVSRLRNPGSGPVVRARTSSPRLDRKDGGRRRPRRGR